MIEKEKVDEELWKIVQGKSIEKVEDKKNAIQLIFENYKKMPEEADEILRGFASQEHPKDVRKTLAIQVSNNKSGIPGGLYLDLISRLKEDPDNEIQKIISPEIREWLEPLTDILQTLKKIEEFKQKPIFEGFEYNWFIFLPLDQMLRLVEMHKEGKDKEIKRMLMRVAKNKTFLKDFMKELSRITLLKPRLHVLKDALSAHLEDKFTLSIPSLLPQIEGILWDIAQKKGIAVGTTIIPISGKKFRVKSVKAVVEHPTMYDLMTSHLADFYLQKVYTRNFRHAIIHGRNPKYNSEEDSMKMIMLLRAVTEIAKNA